MDSLIKLAKVKKLFKLLFLNKIELLGIQLDFSVKVLVLELKLSTLLQNANLSLIFLIKLFLLFKILDTGRILGVGIKVNPFCKTLVSASLSIERDKFRTSLLSVRVGLGFKIKNARIFFALSYLLYFYHDEFYQQYRY